MQKCLLFPGRSKHWRSGQAKRSRKLRSLRSRKTFLSLIELNTSVPQEGCLHHCCSLHGKPLSVSNSETSQQELFVGEPCCFSPFLCSIKPISQRLAVTPHTCSSIMHCFIFELVAGIGYISGSNQLLKDQKV